MHVRAPPTLHLSRCSTAFSSIFNGIIEKEGEIRLTSQWITIDGFFHDSDKTNASEWQDPLSHKILSSCII